MSPNPQKTSKSYRLELINYQRLLEIASKTRRTASAVVNVAIEQYWQSFNEQQSSDIEGLDDDQ